MITVNSTINVFGQSVPQIIPVVQGDTGRSILFTLADFTIPQGSTATYYVQKPSGEAVYNAATIDGNTVLVELTAQSIIEHGDNYGQVRIENDGEVVTSFDFILLVKPFRGIDATQSTTEMNIFDKAVEQASEAIDDAKDAALDEINQTTGNFAEAFSSSKAYSAGEYVMQSGRLYRFTSNHAAGAWTGSDAEAVTVGEELTDVKDGFDDLDDRVTALEEGGSGSGLTEGIKAALLQIASKVAYIDENGQDYYDDLYDSLYPPADLVSISAVYTQSGTVYDTDTLDSLKSDLVVTAHMSDSTTRTVTDYVLSGTLTEGTSTITVAYGGKTTTFNVTVSHASDPSERWTDGVAYDPTIIENEYYEKDTGAIETYSGWNRTDYMPCKNAQIIDVSAIPQIEGAIANNAFFDANHNVVQHGVLALSNHTSTHRVPSNAAYFGVSSESDALATCVAGGITPYAPKSASNMNGWANGIAYADLTIVQDSYITNAGAIQPYAGWDRTDYVPCNGLESITFSPLPQQSGTVDYCGFYYKDKAFCKKITLSKTENSTITVPNGAYYFIISSERAALASCIGGGIVPNT